jgi:hypothetical protein
MSQSRRAELKSPVNNWLGDSKWTSYTPSPSRNCSRRAQMVAPLIFLKCMDLIARIKNYIPLKVKKYLETCALIFLVGFSVFTRKSRYHNFYNKNRLRKNSENQMVKTQKKKSVKDDSRYLKTLLAWLLM